MLVRGIQKQRIRKFVLLKAQSLDFCLKLHHQPLDGFVADGIILFGYRFQGYFVEHLSYENPRGLVVHIGLPLSIALLIFAIG